MRQCFLLLLVVLGMGLSGCTRQPLALTEFSVPTPASWVHHITLGSDGALWFTEDNSDQIGRITTSGTFTEFPLPHKESGLGWLTAGPDGAVWFTEQAGRIGRITPAGKITEYKFPPTCTPTSCVYGVGAGIATGADGALWVADGDQIGRLTTSGTFTTYPVSRSTADLDELVASPDGTLWFTGPTVNAIGRISLTGTVTKYPLPANGGQPESLTLGRDGTIWFADLYGFIGHVRSDGTIQEFAVPDGGLSLFDIVAGPDGAIWFTEAYGKIGRITPQGSITMFSLPAGSNANGITAGPNHTLWFTESNSNKIGSITPGS